MPFWLHRPLVRRAQDILATAGDWFARPATPAQTALAVRLREELRALSVDAREQLPFWQSITDRMRQHAENGDPLYFMRWPEIAATMVNDTTPFAVEAYRQLRRAPEWRERWRPAITHPHFGHGPPFLPNPRTNANTVMHAAHLRRFRRETGRDLLECACIAEFGGGFGSMCRLTARLGLRGRYVIFDLPPILALQRYFLGLHGIEAGYEADGRVVLTSDLDAVAAAIVPGTALMSTWALSEMPLALRARIETLLRDDRAAAVLLAYQHAFEGIDNIVYFQDLMRRNDDLWAWRKIAIDSGSDYVFGVRR